MEKNCYLVGSNAHRQMAQHRGLFQDIKNTLTRMTSQIPSARWLIVALISFYTHDTLVVHPNSSLSFFVFLHVILGGSLPSSDNKWHAVLFSHTNLFWKKERYIWKNLTKIGNEKQSRCTNASHLPKTENQRIIEGEWVRSTASEYCVTSNWVSSSEKNRWNMTCLLE